MKILTKHVLVPSLSGLLYGYNTSIIAGALLLIAQTFSLTSFEEGLLVGVSFLGTCIASFAGILANYWGRKPVLFLSALLFIAGGLASAVAPNVGFLLFARFVVGVAAGVAIVVSPTYLIEVSSLEKRGAILNLNQVGIGVGTLLAYACTYLLGASGNWRLMLGLGMIPAVVQCFGLLGIPESSPKQESKISWKNLLSPQYRPRFTLSFLLAVFQILSGASAIFYFAPSLFADLQNQPNDHTGVFLATLIIGIVYLIGIFISFWTIDHLGRRPLLFTSFAGMGISFFLIALSQFFALPHLNHITMACFLSAIAFYALGVGPIPPLVIGEIGSIHLRGHLMTLMGVLGWILNYGTALVLLPLAHSLGTMPIFATYGFFCLLGIVVLAKMLPETKQKSLEEIDQLFR